ncbi:MAG TPA: hypothetical protein DCX23_02980 [Lachnospiraceae bacterium]|nr:hypothetical protein [Lachnospiraceae bacterium]
MQNAKGKTGKNFIPAAVTAIFIAVVIVFNMVMNYLLIPYSFTRLKVHMLETMQFNNLILGSSHAGTNIDATHLAGLTGRTTFNAAQGEQFPVDSYYLLKDACIDQKPDRVIYEFDPTYWLTAQEIDSSYANMFYEMRPSKEKLQYFFDKMWKVDFRTWLSPWYFYRSQFGNIGANIYTKSTDNYKNYGVATFDSENQTVYGDGFIGVKPGKWEDEITVREWNENMVQKDDEKFFIKMAELCRDEGIELVVVSTPIPAETYEAGRENFDLAYAHMTELSEKYDFRYMCYNTGELKQENLMDSEKFADWDGHMYEDAAHEFTGVFAEDLEAEVRRRPA